DSVSYYAYEPLTMLWPSYFYFFNDTATTEIYTLSLHDALPIWSGWTRGRESSRRADRVRRSRRRSNTSSPGSRNCARARCRTARSEEHTSELQSRRDLVCRLLLEKKKGFYVAVDACLVASLRYA